MRVEASGGVRTPDDLNALLKLGAARVVIGTAALEDPEWVAEACARHGEAVAVGLDARGRTLQARGWTASGGDLFEVWSAWSRPAAAASSTPRSPGTACSPARPPTA